MPNEPNDFERASTTRLARRLRRQHYRMASIDFQAGGEPCCECDAPGHDHGQGHAHGHEHEHHHKHAAAEAEALREQVLRVQAEFDNFRKRTRRDEQQKLDLANQRLLESLLPIIDNFERAMAIPGESVEALKSGIDMVRKQFVDVLQQHGLERVQAEGESFDPRMHEAVAVEAASEQPDNTVVEVFQPGYMLKGRLLRPAMVKVARVQA